MLAINKTDLALAVWADLGVMERDARAMRGSGPFVFAQIRLGQGVDIIIDHVSHAWRHANLLPHTHQNSVIH